MFRKISCLKIELTRSIAVQRVASHLPTANDLSTLCGLPVVQLLLLSVCTIHRFLARISRFPRTVSKAIRRASPRHSSPSSSSSLQHQSSCRGCAGLTRTTFFPRGSAYRRGCLLPFPVSPSSAGVSPGRLLFSRLVTTYATDSIRLSRSHHVIIHNLTAASLPSLRLAALTAREFLHPFCRLLIAP